jgi:hypothetical protein
MSEVVITVVFVVVVILGLDKVFFMVSGNKMAYIVSIRYLIIN